MISPVSIGVGFEQFNRIKADFIRKQSAWSEFQELEPCKVKFSAHTYYEDPVRDIAVLDLGSGTDAEVKQRQNVWSVVVRNVGDKNFSVESTTFTRNSLWGSTKETKVHQYNSVVVARFSDQPTAESLAALIRDQKARCAGR